MSTSEGPNILVEMVHGSHLYGTSTPASDHDFKGVYLPSRDDAYLDQIRKQVSYKRTKASGEKNTSEDIDREFFSLHEFLKLAIEGQTVALDMLHASEPMWVSASDLWRELVRNRHRFHTKKLNAFIGYAARQAAKYGIKGSRIDNGTAFLQMLMECGDMRVDDAIAILVPRIAKLEHAYMVPSNDGGFQLEVLGKRLTGGAKCSHYVSTFERYLNQYGERARMAQQNLGVDWKAMSHAVRAAIEVRAILVDGDFSLPFEPEVAAHLLAIKTGAVDFLVVQDHLEKQLEELRLLSEQSSLPDVADTAWARSFLLDAMTWQ